MTSQRELDGILAAMQDPDLVRMLVAAATATAAGRDVTPPELAEDPFVLWLAGAIAEGGLDLATLADLAARIKDGSDDPEVIAFIDGVRTRATDYLLDRRSATDS